MSTRFLPTMVLGLSLCACSGGFSQLEREVREIRSSLEELKQSIIASRKRLDSLDNRILLLEDQVETQKIACSKSHTFTMNELPTVKILPPQNTEEKYVEERQDFQNIENIYQEIDSNGRLISPSNSNVQRITPKKQARDEQDILSEYQSAYNLYKAGRIDDAMKAFEDFVKMHPKHPYADNAQYWIGECLYDKRRFEDARRAFMKVVTDFPDGNKVPDAMLKAGLCSKMLNKYEEARRMFQAIMLSYPETEAAERAMKLVGELP